MSAITPKEYLDSLPNDRKKVISKLRTAVKKNLPKGFKEEMNYNMLGYVVPHSIYPNGYHCDTSKPLPFINIASQKNFVAVYHMGLYSDKKLMNWFVKAFAKASDAKLDMGKSCIRFKKMDAIPYELMGELAGKVTPQEWINTYEKIYSKETSKSKKSTSGASKKKTKKAAASKWL